MLRRWKAVATYKTNNGPVSFTHCFDEIEELHDLIEAGPDWTTLTSCVVTYEGAFIDAEANPTTQKRTKKIQAFSIAKGE